MTAIRRIIGWFLDLVFGAEEEFSYDSTTGAASPA